MSQKNQGEGNREAARRYNKAVREHKRTHDVDAEARDARKAAASDKGEQLTKAEKAGKARAKEFDPQVKRDH